MSKRDPFKRNRRKVFKNIKNLKGFVRLLNSIAKKEIDKQSFDITVTELLKFSFSNQPKKHYYSFSIPKRSGGKRMIDAPLPRLKHIQQCISILLYDIYDVHPSVCGFIPGKSIVSNASPHTRKQYVFNLDLEDFFPSINSARIIARLQHPPFNLNEKTNRQGIAKLIGEICTLELPRETSDLPSLKVLPQGAPSSPALSNIICQKLDFYLSAIAARFECSYTRYADDITFSSNINIFEVESEFRKEISRVIKEQGFRINPKKTRLQKRQDRQEVTGIIVNQQLNVRKSYIKEIRMWLYYWEQYGYIKASEFYFQRKKRTKKHLKRGGIELINVLNGKLHFLKMVKGADNSTYKKLLSRYSQLAKRLGSEIANYQYWEYEKHTHQIRLRAKLMLIQRECQDMSQRLLLTNNKFNMLAKAGHKYFGQEVSHHSHQTMRVETTLWS